MSGEAVTAVLNAMALFGPVGLSFAAYALGKAKGRDQELERAWPYIHLALPVFKALRDEEATEVRLNVRRTGPNEWAASQTVDREPGGTDR